MTAFASKVRYRCKTCGVEIPPYEQYCEHHREIAELYEKPALLDRVINRILGR